jgi:hypothetical protein
MSDKYVHLDKVLEHLRALEDATDPATTLFISFPSNG